MKKSHKIGLLVLTVLPIILIPVLLFTIIGGGIGLSEMNDPEFVAPIYISSIVFWAVLMGTASLISLIYFTRNSK